MSKDDVAAGSGYDGAGVSKRMDQRAATQTTAFETGDAGETPTPTVEPSRSTNSSGLAPGSGMDIVRPPAYGRGIVVSLASAAAVLALAIMASGSHAKSTGTPLSETTGPLFWGLAVIFVVLTAVGAQFSEFTAAKAAQSLGASRRVGRLPTAWAVPLVAEASAILLVATYHNRLMLVAGPALAFCGVTGALLARDLLDDATDLTKRTAAMVHTLVIHGVAFFALSAVYLNKMSGFASVPLVFFLSGILILEALERGEISITKRIAYAALGAFVLGEATLAINWWPTHGWTGGAALLVCFFAVNGLLVAQVEHNEIRQRDLLEYGLVCLLGLMILAVTL
jgi:hypothetical protein